MRHWLGDDADPHRRPAGGRRHRRRRPHHRPRGLMAGTLLRGGRIRATFDGEVIDSVGVRDGRIVAVNEGSFDEVFDLDGAWVVPGLIDTHPHLLHFSAAAAGLADLAEASDEADIVAAIRSVATERPAG